MTRCFTSALALLACLSVLGSTPLAATPNPYSDPRLVGWSKAFLDRQFGKVIKGVEADLVSGSPHPLAAQHAGHFPTNH